MGRKEFRCLGEILRLIGNWFFVFFLYILEGYLEKYIVFFNFRFLVEVKRIISNYCLKINFKVVVLRNSKYVILYFLVS